MAQRIRGDKQIAVDAWQYKNCLFLVVNFKGNENAKSRS
jgi:hypothetical protein